MVSALTTIHVTVTLDGMVKDVVTVYHQSVVGKCLIIIQRFVMDMENVLKIIFVFVNLNGRVKLVVEN